MDEIVSIIRQIISYLKRDTEYHVQDEIDLDRGHRIFRFKNVNDDYTIICRLKNDTMSWKYCIYKDRKRLTKDEVLLLFTEMNLYFQLKENNY